MDRPLTSEIESTYNELFSHPIDNLITSALYGRLFHDKSDQENISGRGIVWKLFLCPQPPLTYNLSPNPVPPLGFLRDVRVHYTTLLRNTGLSDYHDNADANTSSRSLPSSSADRNDWSLNNPLSLDSSNPWHAYFSAAETRKIIRQDVERAFPEIPYFRQIEVQNALTNILFLYTQGNGDLGYRQGMHELLACIYRVVDYDSVGDDCTNPQLQELCASSYVAADAHALFELVMKYMEPWYEWQPSKNASRTTTDKSSPLKPYVAPIINACSSLRDEKLRSVDPFLWEKLREGGVEPQMYGMRWLRLLFTREFPLNEAMVLWDGLFASVAVEDTPSTSLSSPRTGFEFALWISVAMLMRIRNHLTTGSYTDQLTNLLRYPSISTHDAKPANLPSLLLMQARSLMTYPNPSTGVSITMQNRSELNIPVQQPNSPKQMHKFPSSTFPSKPHSPVAGVSGPSLFDKQRLPDRIHRILDGNDSLNIQRGLQNTLGAISDLRRNLPDISHALSRNPSWNNSLISLHNGGSDDLSVDRNSVNERGGAKSDRHLQLENTELRNIFGALGEAMEWALNSISSEEEGSQGDRDHKEKALQCLAHVKEVLIKVGKGEKAEINIQRLTDPALRSQRPPHEGSPREQAKPLPMTPSAVTTSPDSDNYRKRTNSSSRLPPPPPDTFLSDKTNAIRIPHSTKPVNIPQSDPLGVLP